MNVVIVGSFCVIIIQCIVLLGLFDILYSHVLEWYVCMRWGLFMYIVYLFYSSVHSG